MVRGASWTIAWLLALSCAAWAFGALPYDFPVLNVTAAWAFALALAAIVFMRGAWRKLCLLELQSGERNRLSRRVTKGPNLVMFANHRSAKSPSRTGFHIRGVDINPWIRTTGVLSDRRAEGKLGGTGPQTCSHKGQRAFDKTLL